MFGDGSRRYFLRSLLVWLGSISSALLPRWIVSVRGASVADSVNGDILQDVARVVLPTELDDAARMAAVESFLRWLRGYRAGAVLDHGYGFTKIHRSPDNPAAGYQKDLTLLESRAETEFGASFISLGTQQKRVLIEKEIENHHAARKDLSNNRSHLASQQQGPLLSASASAVPKRPGDSHVAVALVTHYFRSSEANDLCYRRQIGARTCRDLFSATKEPLLLDE